MAADFSDPVTQGGGPASTQVEPLQASALQPVAPAGRVFGWTAHASLWFSLGVGLLVMQVGAYLLPGASTTDALLAIVLGSALGAALLAWTAQLGARTGLTSAALMHHTYGSAFARLPILLNIAQLLGWTTFELVVMRDGTSAIAGQSLGWDLSGPIGIVATTALWGAVLTLLLRGEMTTLVRQTVSRYALPLVIASLLWLSWRFGTQLQTQGLSAFWSRPGDGSMGLLSAMDLVVSMPVSWLPLVADYARFGRSGRGALGGTFVGYAVANVWCFALGVVVASVSQPDVDLVNALLLAQGGLIALSLILVDEIDNAYGDVYSGAVSGHTLRPAWSVQKWGIALAVLCTLLAMVLPMRSIEPFLLLLSSVFVPLYGVILGRWAGRVEAPGQRKVDYAAAAIWILGIAAFHTLANVLPQWGSTLPTLAFTFLVAWGTRPAAQSVLRPSTP